MGRRLVVPMGRRRIVPMGRRRAGPMVRRRGSWRSGMWVGGMPRSEWSSAWHSHNPASIAILSTLLACSNRQPMTDLIRLDNQPL